jgi:large subunit ribosomal protein L29
MKASEIRQMSDDEIRGAFEDAKVEMFNLRFQLAAGSLEDTTRIKALRKDVARYLTVLREREIAAALVAEEGVVNDAE